MKRKLVFATNNAHKLEEVSAIIDSRFEIHSLAEIGCHEDIPETAHTLEGNALLKARYIYEKYGYDCFSDDTGLEVDALNGAPGVRSARYAGEEKDAQANMRKLLSELKAKSNRNARFRTVVALILNGEEFLFDGVVEGKILEEKRGDGGFGYDPIFVPDGFDETFAQLDAEVKNDISHRGKAIRKLAEFLLQRD
ncbi:MAG: non-canonical purine NTP diphosphatase [Paludibacteraceae bacterium]|jgi:XTP/dITP diphosphohydrolase|nr:non-canonical purine NTP diphosphatase [Paludibacteraceae bacterium]